MSANSGVVPDAWEDSWENQADVRNNGLSSQSNAIGLSEEPLQDFRFYE